MSGRPGGGRSAGGPGGSGGRRARAGRPGGGRPGGMMGMGMGLPPAKAKDFRGSFRRLLGHLRPEAPRIVLVVAPRRRQRDLRRHRPEDPRRSDQPDLRGRDQRQLPAGATQQQVIAGLRAAARTSSPTCSRHDLTPGAGIDFGALGRSCSMLVGVYVISSLFAWMQGYIMAGVTQRTRPPPPRPRSTASSAGCRCATSTATPAATC